MLDNQRVDTAKSWIKDLVEICAIKGLEHVVISPGSRSAPLVISFSRHPKVKCYTIIDERSAAFFALGIAQQKKRPVGLVCTSGTALLNYAPALAEAYYQRIPLVVLSADRPNEFVDQADGQTIRQFDAFRNFIRGSFQLPVDASGKDESWHSNRIVSEALNRSIHPIMGPVHINIPLREPLYDLTEYHDYNLPKVFDLASVIPKLDDIEKESLIKSWNASNKKLILVGLQDPDEKLTSLIETISSDPSVVLLTETTSNLAFKDAIQRIDPVLEAMSKEEKQSLQPDLLVSLGGDIVSKKIKAYLRKYPPQEHWRIDASVEPIDTFMALTKLVGVDAVEFFSAIAKDGQLVKSDYGLKWKSLNEKAHNIQSALLQETSFCDFTVFKKLIENIPANSNLHFANSTPVRYSNLFEMDRAKNIKVNANRGTSGIEGSISTAAGAAIVNNMLTTIISGDLGFFYDSHAFWNKHLPSNLRVIVINNSGGNIFKIIPGPSELDELEDYFETRQEQSVEPVAKAYEIPYYFCDDFETLENSLQKFFQPNDKPAILEIKTPGDLSAKVLKEYMFNSSQVGLTVSA